jgi:hypothetical protein
MYVIKGELENYEKKFAKLIHIFCSKRSNTNPKEQLFRIRFRPGHRIPDTTGSRSTTLNFFFLHLFEVVSYFADTMRHGFSASRQVKIVSSIFLTILLVIV